MARHPPLYSRYSRIPTFLVRVAEGPIVAVYMGLAVCCLVQSGQSHSLTFAFFHYGHRPQFDHKPALMRAYKAADKGHDGFIQRREFRLLLKYIVYFNKLWDKFEEIDSDGDRRLTLEEFTRSTKVVGLALSAEAAAAEFAKCDANKGGFVLFDEFCSWAVKTHLLDEEEEREKARFVSSPTVSSPLHLPQIALHAPFCAIIIVFVVSPLYSQY